MASTDRVGANLMGARQRTTQVRLEPLEGRSLLSGLLIALQPHVYRPGVAQIADLAAAQVHKTTSSAAVASTAATTSPVGVYSGADGPNAGVPLPASPLLGSAAPTPKELAREKFVAQFAGPMATLAPRFTDQSKIIYLHGLGGSSPKFFLHGDYALAMVFPAQFDRNNPGGTYDPTTGSGVKPVTGFAFLDDKNNNSGGRSVSTCRQTRPRSTPRAGRLACSSRPTPTCTAGSSTSPRVRAWSQSSTDRTTLPRPASTAGLYQRPHQSVPESPAVRAALGLNRRKAPLLSGRPAKPTGPND